MRVRFSEKAIQDLTQITDYIYNEAGSATANKVASLGLPKAKEVVEQFPSGNVEDGRSKVLHFSCYQL